MKILKCSFSILILCFFIIACDGSDKEPSKESGNNEDTGIVSQLEILKAEISTLKNELAVTNAKVDELSSGKSKKNTPIVTSVILKHIPIATAKIAIVEFTDYQCPYCARHVKQVLPSIYSNYIDKGLVHYEIRDFPLRFHPLATGAAIAVNCVGAKNYWRMHDWVFENPKLMNNESYKSQAKLLGVNENEFSDCLKSSASANAVDQDLKYGRALGVSGTPKFFIGKIEGDKIINVSQINGAAQFTRFEQEIKNKM